MNPTDFADGVREGGAIFVLTIGLFFVAMGAVREWWVPGPTHKRTVERADRLEDKLERALGVVGQATDVAEAVVATEKRRRA